MKSISLLMALILTPISYCYDTCIILLGIHGNSLKLVKVDVVETVNLCFERLVFTYSRKDVSVECTKNNDLKRGYRCNMRAPFQSLLKGFSYTPTL